MPVIDFTVPKENITSEIMDESKQTSLTGRSWDEFWKMVITCFYYFCLCLFGFYSEFNLDRCDKLNLPV